MVHQSGPGKRSASMVKVEVEEEEEYFLEDQPSPHIHKRPKLDTSPTFLQSESDLSDVLEEPSPLGLRLKKSPSLLDLIQMKLSQEKTTPLSSLISKKVQKEKGSSAGTSVLTTDKLKASNFPASLLKIGTWQYKSRYEGDLVAKCYFAKHKLVWEVLDGGLKNKIEIQWSDIVAIKANFLNDEPETLDVVLARQPLFFRETNPQPRKHTLWQATSDFTDGQASIHRRHFLQCHQGFLGKHFEKLTQCDPRLSILSQQPEIVLESPYFDQMFSAFHNLNESHEMPPANDKEISSGFSLRDVALGPGVLSSSLKNECQGSKVEPQEVISEVSPTHTKGNFTDQPSISNDEQTRGNISEDVAEYLLGDNEVVTSLDEQSLVSQVNSLRCILQKDYRTQSLMAKDRKDLVQEHGSTSEINSKNASGCEKGPVISSNDSVGDLLLGLPRIASLPQFLYNM